MILDAEQFRFAILPNILGAAGVMYIYKGDYAWGVSANGNCGIYDTTKLNMPVSLFMSSTISATGNNTHMDLIFKEMLPSGLATRNEDRDVLGYFFSREDSPERKLGLTEYLFLNDKSRALYAKTKDDMRPIFFIRGTDPNTSFFKDVDSALIQSFLMPKDLIDEWYDQLNDKPDDLYAMFKHDNITTEIKEAQIKNVLLSLNYFLNMIENG